MKPLAHIAATVGLSVLFATMGGLLFQWGRGGRWLKALVLGRDPAPSRAECYGLAGLMVIVAVGVALLGFPSPNPPWRTILMNVNILFAGVFMLRGVLGMLSTAVQQRRTNVLQADGYTSMACLLGVLLVANLLVQSSPTS